MRASEHLRNLSGEDWVAATRHAFTDTLATGTLDTRKMQGYLQQDYLLSRSTGRAAFEFLHKGTSMLTTNLQRNGMSAMLLTL